MIKDIFNYVGNKYKLLDRILPIVNGRKVFVDVFGGSGVVGVNQDSEILVYNDKLWQLTNILQTFYNLGGENSLIEVDKTISKYNLSKVNKEGFLNARNDYNLLKDKTSQQASVLLYSIVIHSFNYQMGFNSSGEFNVSFGKDRSSFNPSLRARFVDFIDKMQKKQVVFTKNSFEDIIKAVVNKVPSKDIVFYLDPPYLISDDSYSRTKYVKWGQELEERLYTQLSYLNTMGFSFVLSNVIENNGNENTILKKWAKQFNVAELDRDYSNCNYQKGKAFKNKEILVTNF